MAHNASLQVTLPTRGLIGQLPASMAERKKFLAELVPALSLNEIWILRSTLASLDLRTDVYGRLPPELQLMVAAYLDPADLGACVDVSRKWRRIVVDQLLYKDVMMRCYPGLLQSAELSGAAEAKALAKAGVGIRAQTGTETRTETEADTEMESQTGGGPEDPGDENGATTSLVAATIASAARAYTRLARGKFHSVYRHCRTPALDPNMEMTHLSWLHPHNLHSKPTAEESADRGLYSKRVSAYEFEKYAYGRIVWQCLEALATSFLVDDLRTGQRFHMRQAKDVVKGRTFYFCAVGDEILVASSGMHLIAWKFTTGERDTKALPAHANVVSTAGNRICLLLSSDSIYVWEFGGALRQVDMTGLDSIHREPYRDGQLVSYFVLNPKQADVFYHGTYQVEPKERPGQGVMFFHLHEYEGLHYVRTHTYSIHYTDFASSSGLIESLSWRNSHGLYTVMSWQVSVPSRSIRSTWTGEPLEGIRSVAFNIYTKRFTDSFFRLPRTGPPSSHSYVRICSGHIWNNQLTVLFDRHKDSSTNRAQTAPPLLFVFADESSHSALLTHSRPFFSVPFMSSENPPDEQELHGDGDIPDYSEDDETQTDLILGPTKVSDSAVHYSSKITDPARAHRRELTFKELTTDKGVWNVDNADWRKSCCKARYALDLATKCVRDGETQPVFISEHCIYGDDNFVFFLHRNRYTVWCF